MSTFYDASAVLNRTEPMNCVRKDSVLEDGARSAESESQSDGNLHRRRKLLQQLEAAVAGQPTSRLTATPLLPTAERSTELRQTAAALLAVAAAARDVEAAAVEAARARQDAAVARQAAAASEALATAATAEAAWLREAIEVRCRGHGGRRGRTA